jgi:hypothetical protein
MIHCHNLWTYICNICAPYDNDMNLYFSLWYFCINHARIMVYLITGNAVAAGRVPSRCGQMLRATCTVTPVTFRPRLRRSPPAAAPETLLWLRAAGREGTPRLAKPSSPAYLITGYDGSTRLRSQRFAADTAGVVCSRCARGTEKLGRERLAGSRSLPDGLALPAEHWPQTL